MPRYESDDYLTSETQVQQSTRPGSAGGADAGPILFVHIPKTAGTSLWTALGQAFGESRVLRLHNAEEVQGEHFARTIATHLADMRVIGGHLPWHVAAGYRHIVRPFTVLRDPVARVLSLFRFLCRAPPAELERLGLAPGFSFEAFFTSTHPELRGQPHDGMCRQLSASPRWLDFERADFWEPTPVALLREAVAALEGFDIGLAEDMAATARLMQAIWHLPAVPEVGRENATEPDPVDTDSELLLAIVAANRLDLALYEQARARFVALVAGLALAGPDGAAAGTVFTPVLGAETPIGGIPGRSGFHAMEPEGIAWLTDPGPARVTLVVPEGARRFCLKLFTIVDTYPVAECKVTLDGVPLRAEAMPMREKRWCQLETESRDLPAGLHTLAIRQPYVVPVRFLDPGSADARALGLAIAEIAVLR